MLWLKLHADEYQYPIQKHTPGTTKTTNYQSTIYVIGSYLSHVYLVTVTIIVIELLIYFSFMTIVITSWATHIQQHVTATYIYISLRNVHHPNSKAFISTIYVCKKLVQHILPCYITYIKFFFLSCNSRSKSGITTPGITNTTNHL